MNLDEFLTKMGCYEMDVYCENGSDRANLIQFLLDNGFEHGYSGWSRQLLANHDADTKDGSHWNVVKISGNNTIEFRSARRAMTIPYSSIAHLIAPTVDIDDLV